MPLLIPVKYGKRTYPPPIVPKLQEIPAHFDSNVTPHTLAQREIERYSLHTEYSYFRKYFKNPACRDLKPIKVMDKKGIPLLWYDKKWSSAFADFIFRFVGNNTPPEVIEIHPPFIDYCPDMVTFLERYSIFEERILEVFSSVTIVLENRYGTQHNGKFLVSTNRDLIQLSQIVDEYGLKLKLAVDIPQLFGANGLTIGNFDKHKIAHVLKPLHYIRANIKSIHLWGKCYGKNNRVVSHAGTLDSYFKGLPCQKVPNGPGNNMTLEKYLSKYTQPAERHETLKEFFLRELYSLLEDGIKRYFVPEVNRNNDDLHLIVQDLLRKGFTFL